MIFVTEDFSSDKQVKLDNPNSAVTAKVPILKCNFTKRFNTGIYPYSMMVSSFVATNRNIYPNILKATCTSQEWCGQTYTQLNNRNNQFNIQSYSYFETEGDKIKSLKTSLVEDELFTLIRLNPATLPQGNIEILEGLMHQRLTHKDFNTIAANATVADISENPSWLKSKEKLRKYCILFTDSKRELNIYFTSIFPFVIQGWEDTFSSSKSGEHTTTRGVKNRSILLDYWKHNQPIDSTFRKDSLDLHL